MRLFALVLTAALALRIIERIRWEPAGLGLRRSPVCLAGAVLLLLYVSALLASMAFSVFPQQSFWGTYHQRGGGLTELCGILFLVAVATELLKVEGQIRRLVTAAFSCRRFPFPSSRSCSGPVPIRCGPW